jgi:hypothetical protein
MNECKVLVKERRRRDGEDNIKMNLRGRMCEGADWRKERCAQRRKVSLEMSIAVGLVFLVP